MQYATRIRKADQDLFVQKQTIAMKDTVIADLRLDIIDLKNALLKQRSYAEICTNVVYDFEEMVDIVREATNGFSKNIVDRIKNLKSNSGNLNVVNVDTKTNRVVDTKNTRLKDVTQRQNIQHGNQSKKLPPKTRLTKRTAMHPDIKITSVQLFAIEEEPLTIQSLENVPQKKPEVTSTRQIEYPTDEFTLHDKITSFSDEIESGVVLSKGLLNCFQVNGTSFPNNRNSRRKSVITKLK